MMLKFGHLACAGVSLISLASPAFGQDSPTNQPVNEDDATAGSLGEEIVVQARRRFELLQDVPLVVNAVTSESIEKLNIREFEDVENLVPGLQLGSNANGIGAQASLRGVAFDVNASGNNGTVEFYLNDAPLSAGILFQSMFDVGQIEVLRGPQGTLRGRASPSGSITVTSRRPDLSEAGGYATGTLNDIGGWNVNGAVNVPIVTDILAVRFAGVVDENEGNRVSSINSDIDPSVNTVGGRISIAAEPADFISLFASYTQTDREAVQFAQVESNAISVPGAPASPTFIEADDRLGVSFQPFRYRQNFEVFNWQAQLRFAGQKLDYVGSHNDQSYASSDPNDRGGVFGPAFPAAVRSAALVSSTKAKQTTHEVRLSNDDRVFGMFDYVVGVLHNKFESPSNLINQQILFLGFIPPGGTFTPIPQRLAPAPLGGPVASAAIQRNGEGIEKSIFGNITLHLSDDTEISGGIRYIDFKALGGLAINGVEVPAAREDRNPNHTIYSASIKHNFTRDLMVYASYGSSWRPGSSTNPIIFRELVSPGPLLSSFYFPGDETSNSYEVGLKSEWLNNRLRVNVSAYQQDFENYAYSTPNVYVAGLNGAGVDTVFLAAPGLAVGVPARVRGVEAEFALRPVRNWDLAATVSYSKGKIRDGVIPCNNYGGQVPASAAIIRAANGGEQVATCTVDYRSGLSAPFSATLQSEYLQPLSPTMDGYLRGLVNFAGNSQNEPANPFDDVDSYATANVFAGIRDRDGGWEIGGYVKNLFGVERVLARRASPLGVSYTVICNPAIPGLGAACPGGTVVAGGATSSTYREIAMTPPREFGITARIQIGSR